MNFVEEANQMRFLSLQLLGHASGGVGDGFMSGFLHPVFGFDHLVAMVAVGLWGAQLRQPAIWVLPVTFPLVMAFGGVFGANGLSLPAVEQGIAISAVVLGIMVAFCVRPPFWVAGVMVGVFAFFHGHAHGSELPHAVVPLAYGAGFVIATGLLHLAGIALGALIEWKRGDYFVRSCGVAVCVVGLYFLCSSLLAT